MTAGNSSEGSEQPISVLRSELDSCRSDVERLREKLRKKEEEFGQVRVMETIDERERKFMNSVWKPMRVRSRY